MPNTNPEWLNFQFTLNNHYGLFFLHTLHISSTIATKPQDALFYQLYSKIFDVDVETFGGKLLQNLASKGCLDIMHESPYIRWYRIILIAPHGDKTNKTACVPSENSYQPGHLPSLIRVFTVCMKKLWVLSYPLSAQWRLWSDWMDAQADLNPRWVHIHFVVLSCHGSHYFFLNFQCIGQLDEEEKSDIQLKEQFKERWTRTASASLTKPMRDECQKYKTILDTAIGADKIVRDKYDEHKQAFALLSKPAVSDTNFCFVVFVFQNGVNLHHVVFQYFTFFRLINPSYSAKTYYI